MLIDLLLIWLSGLVLTGIGLWFCGDSSVMLSERNKLRKYTGEYYDVEISETLDKMGKTRQQALKEMK